MIDKYFDDEIDFLGIKKNRLFSIPSSDVEEKAKFGIFYCGKSLQPPTYLQLHENHFLLFVVCALFWTGNFVKLKTMKFHTVYLRGCWGRGGGAHGANEPWGGPRWPYDWLKDLKKRGGRKEGKRWPCEDSG